MATLPNNSFFGVPGTTDTVTFDDLFTSGSSTALFSGADTNMFIDTDPSSAGGLLLNAGTEPGLTIQDSTVFLNAIEPTSQTTAVTNETLLSSGTVFNIMENTGSNGDNALRWAGTWRFNGDTFRRGTGGSRMLLGNNQSGFRFRWVIGVDGLDIQSYGTGALTVHHGALDPTGTVLQGLRLRGLVPGNLTGLVGQFGFAPSNLALSSGTFATSSLSNTYGYSVRSLDQNLTGGVTDDDDGSANNHTLYTNTDLRPVLIGGRAAGADFSDVSGVRQAVWQVNRFVSLWFADPIWTDEADADNLLLGIANNNGASDGSPAEIRVITTHNPSYIDNATDSIIDNVKIRYAKPFRYKAETYASGTVPAPITTDGTTSGTVALNGAVNQAYNGFLILDGRYYIAPSDSTAQSPLNLPQPVRPVGSTYVVRVFTHDAPYTNTLLPNSAISTTNDTILPANTRVNDINAYLNGRAFNTLEIDAATTLTDFADIFPAIRQVWYNDPDPSMTLSSFGLAGSGTTITYDADVAFTTTDDTSIILDAPGNVVDSGFTVQFTVAQATGITFQKSSGFSLAQIEAAFTIGDTLRLGGTDEVEITNFVDSASFVVISFTPNPLAVTIGDTIEIVNPAVTKSYAVSMNVDPVITGANTTHNFDGRILPWDGVKIPTGGITINGGTHTNIGNLTNIFDGSGFITWTATGTLIINGSFVSGDVRRIIGNVGGTGTITINNTSGFAAQLDNVGLLPSTLTINAGTDTSFSSTVTFDEIGGTTGSSARVQLFDITDENTLPTGDDLLATGSEGFEVDSLTLTTSGSIVSAGQSYRWIFTQPGFNHRGGVFTIAGGTDQTISVRPTSTEGANLTALTAGGSPATITTQYTPMNIPQNGFQITGFANTTHPSGDANSRPNADPDTGLIYNGVTGIDVAISTIVSSGDEASDGNAATAPFISMTNNTGGALTISDSRLDASLSIISTENPSGITDPSIRLRNAAGDTIFVRTLAGDSRPGTYLLTDRAVGNSIPADWPVGETFYFYLNEATADDRPFDYIINRFSMTFDNNDEVYVANTNANHVAFSISGARAGTFTTDSIPEIRLSETMTNNIMELSKADPSYGEGIAKLGLRDEQQLVAHTGQTQTSVLNGFYFVNTGQSGNQQNMTNFFEQESFTDVADGVVGNPNGSFITPTNNTRIVEGAFSGNSIILSESASGISFSDFQAGLSANIGTSSQQLRNDLVNEGWYTRGDDVEGTPAGGLLGAPFIGPVPTE